MLKIPIDQLKEKIKEKSGLSDKEINTKIKDKMDLLAGLISEEGAAHIIANELGIKLFDENEKLKIKNVLGGLRNVEIEGKVIKIYEIKEFDKNNKKGKLGSFLIGDETGIIRVVAWNEKSDILPKLKENDILKIENAYSRDNNGRVELHLGDKAKVTITEGNINVNKIKEITRKKIKDLKEGDDNVEILGTIIQVFDPKFFEICPDCGKRVKKKEEGFFCEQHNIIIPNYSYVLNLILDDNTDNLRIVLWKNQLQNLLKMSDNEILEKKDKSFENEKTELLGKIVKFVGRVNKNTMFERLEFIPSLVYTEPNPDEEIERLNKEIEELKNKEKTADKEEIKKKEKDTEEDISKDAESLLEELEDIKDLDDLDSI